MLKVIGLAGKQNSGKDTFADVFVNHGYAKMAFADPIKDAVQRVFKIDEKILWGNSEDRDLKTRNILQVFGTDIARKLDPDIWVVRTLERIKNYVAGQGDYLGRCKPVPEGSNAKIIVPDVRLPIEAQALKTLFGAPIILIQRPHTLLQQDTWTTVHASETAVDKIPPEDVTHRITNSGSREQLLLKAEELLQELDA